MDRRHFMKHVAGYSLLALPGMQFIRNIQANAQELRRNNKSVIVMWMGGGPATIDIWDLKPGRPTGGDFRPIQTDAPGVMISEHMKETAKVMKNLAIIRSLTTTEGDHMRGNQLMHTSYTPNPAIAFPSIGSIVSHEAPKLAGYREISLPNYVSVGGAGGPGFLGMTYAPFTIQNPGTPPENVRAPQGLGGSEVETEDRIQRRRRLWNTVEGQFMLDRTPHLAEKDRAKFADGSKNHNDVYQRAFQLIASKDGKVFDLKGESAASLASYGNTNFGRSALMARRLVEAGVSAVEISLGGWDTHNANFNALATRQLPPLDMAMSSLVKDLVDRGMWQNTTLIWMGEFARTPRINQNAGRDHWSRCWSIVVGGGAIKGGQAYGSTDEDGLAVKDNPVKIGDVFASIYRGLGIDPSTQVRDSIGRPFAIAGGNGRPIEQLF
ncbi:MAG: DUF1501 domain-containing protein [Gemmataceae bacterium]|nr:DUF1501 domain-containing protein [Gemmataceae bacterium]